MSAGERDVFVNCPFDSTYEPIFHAIVFAVFAYGYRARCALEVDDGGALRLETIVGLIRGCRFGVHDLSRTGLSAKGALPRFNMPFELGLFLGAIRFGGAKQRGKRCLVLDQERDRYRDFISDLAGQEIKAHDNDPVRAISAVREFLRANGDETLPGGLAVASDYARFQNALPALLRQARIARPELTFPDLTYFVTQWLTMTKAG